LTESPECVADVPVAANWSLATAFALQRENNGNSAILWPIRSITSQKDRAWSIPWLTNSHARLTGILATEMENIDRPQFAGWEASPIRGFLCPHRETCLNLYFWMSWPAAVERGHDPEQPRV
jgi:hypothetical protein